MATQVAEKRQRLDDIQAAILAGCFNVQWMTTRLCGSYNDLLFIGPDEMTSQMHDDASKALMRAMKLVDEAQQLLGDFANGHDAVEPVDERATKFGFRCVKRVLNGKPLTA